MSILITGGASQIGLAVAKLLTAAGRDVLFTSRAGGTIADIYQSSKLDWYNATTFTNPFASAEETGKHIEAIYILPPPGNARPDEVVNPFLEIAIEKGVKRFVVLGGSNMSKEDGRMTGIGELLDAKGVEYVVVKPTWFIENFATQHAHTIKATNSFVSCVPTGKIPFIAVQDIGQAVYDALIAVGDGNEFKEKTVIGPELLTYDDAAKIFSEELGRTITHNVEPKEALIARLVAWGVPEEYSIILAGLNERAEGGSEVGYLEKLGKERVHVGKVTLREWVKY